MVIFMNPNSGFSLIEIITSMAYSIGGHFYGCFGPDTAYRKKQAGKYDK